MDKRDIAANEDASLDIEKDDVLEDVTDSTLKNEDGERPDTDPRDAVDPAVIAEIARYGRDAYLVKSDLDPDEHNGAPGIREQD